MAAYRLDRRLGLGMVPVTVVSAATTGKAVRVHLVGGRHADGRRRSAACQGSAPPDAVAWNRQISIVRVFDQLVFNFDRDLGNLLIDGDWRVWMIDHTRAFKIFKTIGREKQLGTRCARQLLAALRGLDGAALRERMGDVLSPGQVEAVLARRDRRRW